MTTGLVVAVAVGGIVVVALAAALALSACFAVGVVVLWRRGKPVASARGAVRLGAESVSQVLRRSSLAPVPVGELEALEEATEVGPPPLVLAGPLDGTTAGRLGQALRHAALQRTIEGLSRVVCDHAVGLVQADRADCLFFDPGQHVLWRADSTVDLPVEGLVGRVATTARPLLVERAGVEPAYRRDIDDPGGTGSEALLMAPVLDGQHHVHAVVILVRDRRPFTAQEQVVFRLFAQRMSIVFEAVHLESLRAAEMRDAIASDADRLFDPVALAHHRQGRFGEVVEFPPLLPPVAYFAAVLAIVGLLGVGGVARLNRYASGPALVTSPTAVNIASPVSAILEQVDVAAGDRVRAGQPVAHLYAEVERADVRRAEREFSQRLVRRLAEPSDAALEAEVAESRVALERARGRLLERVLTAPRDGVVDDIQLVAGQQVEAGQTVVSLGPDDGRLRILCAIPANHRPTLALGQTLRFEPEGYPFSFQRVVVTAIGNRVFGPSELRSVFGREVGDTLAVDGPVVVVEAAMDGRSFSFDGVDYRFHPGMLGKADIRVADEPALFAVLPFLKPVFRPGS